MRQILNDGFKGNDVPVCVECECDTLEDEEDEEEAVPIQCSGPCKLFYHKKCANSDEPIYDQSSSEPRGVNY